MTCWVAGRGSVSAPGSAGVSLAQRQGRRSWGVVTWIDRAPVVSHPEVEESYRILRERIDLTRLPKHSRDVTERVIYASADFDYFTDLVCEEDALEDAVAALAAGAPGGVG